MSVFDLQLSHYSSDPLKTIESRSQGYQQRMHKPNGLSISVDGEFDWKWWCEAENWYVDGLKVQTRIILHNDANILHIATSEALRQFGRTYRKSLIDFSPLSNIILDGINDTINWKLVSQTYQGIIISPYLWECRKDTKCHWYYGWDCASGYIWDTTAIKKHYLINDWDQDWVKNGF